jgi:peptidoglycan hydrolase-like protein with peptidoglycan-binding domain
VTDNIDTRNLDALAGAVYFTVGRGTEGGSASYRLSVAGVDKSEWGQVSAVAANSGYSMGTIQVDFGQRGTWPLGAIENRKLNEGEKTYVDAVIEQASAYAKQHGLKFTDDLAQLRTDLLTHGNGEGKRSSITYIDTDTRDSINAWASSDEGKKWIHSNIDYPQVRNATQTAMSILDKHGSNVPEDRRFEAINILAKTANQFPSQLEKLEKVLKDGGDYDALLAKTKEIKGTYSFYDGPKAASVAEKYENNYGDPSKKEALDRAHAKVSKRDFDPNTEKTDEDLKQAKAALGGGSQSKSSDAVLEQGESGKKVRKLEANLAGLGYVDAQSQALAVDGKFTAETKQAVEAYQRGANLQPVDGKAGPKTLGSIDETVRGLQENLNKLGVTGPNGKAIGVDGYYGDGTRDAVKAFQEKNGLDPTGIADPKTLDAIKNKAQQLGQTDPARPVDAKPEPAPQSEAERLGRANPIFNQAMQALEKLGPNGGFANREQMERAAGTIAFEAKVTGMERVDKIVASTDGKGLIAVQINPNNPHDVNREYVDKSHAATQPLNQSLQQLNAETQRQDQESRKIIDAPIAQPGRAFA